MAILAEHLDQNKKPFIDSYKFLFKNIKKNTFQKYIDIGNFFSYTTSANPHVD